MGAMEPAYEIGCSHCGESRQFPARCHFGLDDQGRASLLARPERDAVTLLGQPLERLRALGRLRVGLPTACLACGHLGAHRADEQGAWCCEGCGGSEIYPLGLDLRRMRRVGGVLLSALLVVWPAAAPRPILALPGVVFVVLYWAGGAWLDRRGRERLACAPCVSCGHAGLEERPIVRRRAGPRRSVEPELAPATIPPGRRSHLPRR